MTQYTTDRLRNVALVAHGGAGKTQLAEALLFTAGSISRFGKVDEGTSTCDYDPEEIDRKISINTAIASCDWRGHKINLFDTPGYFDFVGEVKAALRVADAAVIVCDAQSGLEVGTEMVWRYAAEHGLPRLIYINKMDRDNADFAKVLDQLEQAFGSAVTALQLPIGSASGFTGVVSLLDGQAYSFREGKAERGPVHDDLGPEVEARREMLAEKVAETDYELLEQYLEAGALDDADLLRGLRQGVISGEIVPVLCGAGLSLIAVEPLLDAMVDLLPSPADRTPIPARRPGSEEEVPVAADPAGPFTALVFKTVADQYVGKINLFRVCSGSIKADSTVHNVTHNAGERLGPLFTLQGREQKPVTEAVAGDIVGAAKLQHCTTGDSLAASPQAGVILPPIEFPKPVFSVAVEPRSKADEDKIGASLARLAEEDPTFRVERNVQTRQTLLYGMGELHLEIITGRLKRKFGVEVDLTRPRVPYLETITRTAQAEYKHKKQSGGRGQYGHVFIRLEPLPRGEEFAFDEEIFGGVVPKQYIPAVEKGVREAMDDGVLAGYPVTDVKVVLYDGSHHSVDSSEMAFKIAAAQAFRKGFHEAGPVLLEPIVKVEVYGPEEYMGDIMGDLNKRRGKILGMESLGGTQVVRAHVPLAEMFTYASDLRSMTQGRGTYMMEHSHYEEVPEPIARQVIAERASATG